MRSVVFGAGAVGGVVGARLHQAGHDVALIARGAHLAELQRSGLTLETPSERTALRIPAAAEPAELGVGASGSEDVVLLATKSQDTAGAKLILNLSNAVNAVCAADERREELAVSAQEEGRAALDAAGMATEQASGHAAPGELSVDDVLAAVVA